MFGSGVISVTMVYRAWRENARADALSRSPATPPPTVGVAEGEAQMASVDTSDISSLLQADPAIGECSDLPSEQRELKIIIDFLKEDKLLEDPVQARKLAAQEPQFSLIGGVLYYIDSRHDHRKRVVVHSDLREKLLREAHGGTHGGHFSSHKLYNSLLMCWWWQGMYADVLKFCKSCPDCAVVAGGSST